MLPEGERSMTFYHVARVDGLERRVETPSDMTEYFINRDDFLIYRHVEFTGRQKKFGPSDASNERSIQVYRSDLHSQSLYCIYTLLIFCIQRLLSTRRL